MKVMITAMTCQLEVCYKRCWHSLTSRPPVMYIVPVINMCHQLLLNSDFVRLFPVGPAVD